MIILFSRTEETSQVMQVFVLFLFLLLLLLVLSCFGLLLSCCADLHLPVKGSVASAGELCIHCGSMPMAQPTASIFAKYDKLQSSCQTVWFL